ncbi:MAG: DUF58 domain-containing protein [Vicinamibacterales bacterium]
MSLDPAVVAAIEDLEFAARRIVESARTGLHRSPLHGFNAEFHQYRAYRPGDDLRHLDWKLLARTDRLYTRQFRETTSLDAVVVLDASASMDFPGPNGRGKPAVSKFRYAVAIGAALAWLISSQGDAVGLVSAAGSDVVVPPRRGRAHLRALLARMAKLTPSGSAGIAGLTRRAADLLRKRGALLVISDFYDDEDAARREMAHAVRRGHDVTMLQTVAPQEIQLDARGAVRFADLETGAEITLDADAARLDYRAALAAFLERTRALAGAHGIDYRLAQTSTPPDDLLRHYLLRRGSLPMAAAASAKAGR